MSWRHKLYPGYKKRKRRVHPDDVAPEVGHQQEVDKQQAIQDEDMEKGEYTQDPEQEDLSQQVNYSEKVGPDDIILEGLEEEKAKFGERDKAIEAAGKAKRKGYLTDEDYLDRLKDAASTPLNTILSHIEKPIEFGSNVWQDTKEWAPWYDVGGNIGALGARGIESWLTVDADNFQELGFELVQKTLDYRKGLAGEIVGEIPIVKENLAKLGNTLNRLRKPRQTVQNLDGTLSIVDDSIDGSKPLMSKSLSKGEGYSYRKGRPLKNPIYDNLSPKVQKGFTDAGIDSDKATFFIENWTREVGANVEGFPFTDRTFEFMQGELLPKILEDMKGINLSDGLQLDHIAQLKAMTPFYKGRNLKQAEKIRRILIKEGIFGGHNPKNLKYLPTDVHTVKTNFWKQNVGDAGEKFFEGRPMRTYADVEKAAKEMKNFINRSNNIVETVSAQYKFMRKKKISAEELDKILKKVDLNYGTYNLKEVRKLIKEEINVDTLAKSKKGLEDAKEAAEAVEFKEKKTFLPHEIEDLDPADIPKRKRTRKKKSELEKIAEREFKKEQKRIEKLGGQTELPLDE